ncbi:MAG: rRNA pseudouridine synthase [Puniceicoccales bacterium]|jgi:pseudouridine synthase|nr:rRNA pseudouridine synthase [Puniceicoccales bacterium]
MRLQKFLALQTTNSRRKAEELIRAGLVTINGEVAKIGVCIDPEVDSIAVNGQKISSKCACWKKSPLVLVMNKPSGCVCSHADRYNGETIFDFIPREFCKKKLMFCGRLDKETEGMVIITDDGDFAQKLTHPSFGVKKHYEVALSRPLTTNVLQRLLHGVEDGGEFLKFDKVIPIGHGNAKNLTFEIVLSQGRKNEIHRMFERFGIFVKWLKRVRIGNLGLRGVSPGRCRKLEEKEIPLLFQTRRPSSGRIPVKLPSNSEKFLQLGGENE